MACDGCGVDDHRLCVQRLLLVRLVLLLLAAEPVPWLAPATCAVHRALRLSALLDAIADLVSVVWRVIALLL